MLQNKTILALSLMVIFLTASIATTGPNTFPVFDAFDPPDATFTYCDVATPQPRVACDTGGSGKGSEDGWFDVTGMDAKQVVIRVVTLGATTLEYTVEGRIALSQGTNTFSSATADLILPIDFSAVNNGQIFKFVEHVDQIRIGVRESVGSGVDSTFVAFDAF